MTQKRKVAIVLGLTDDCATIYVQNSRKAVGAFSRGAAQRDICTLAESKRRTVTSPWRLLEFPGFVAQPGALLVTGGDSGRTANLGKPLPLRPRAGMQCP